MDGTPLGGLTRGKRAALLAYLAVETGQDHSRETLATLLWPEADPHTARGNLRQQLFHLRKGLGEYGELIQPGRQYVRFHRDPQRVWVDVHALHDSTPRCGTEPDPEQCSGCLAEMAERAALYQGPFLQDLPLETDNEAFFDWCQTHREAARRQTLTLLERLSQCYEALGTPGQALATVQRYLTTEPFDEGGHRLAMRLLAADGHSDAVSAQYAQCRAILERELGAPPSPETEALARELAPATSNGAGALPPEPLPPSGERRQVTALHGELTLPGENDPENVLERLQPLMQRMRAHIEALGGVVERQYGTGLLAYFGFPATHEGVAVDAVQAAFKIRQEIDGLPEAGVRVGLGVHTGTVIAEGHSADPTGMLSRQAARLHEQLGPGEIGVSETTRELVQGFFRIDNEPAPGEPATYRVLAVGGADNRFMPRRGEDLAPLQGRGEELAYLQRLWRATCNGEGAVVHISGEPGVGKSRLLHELVQDPGDTPMLVRHYRCQRDSQEIPLHPIRNMLSELTGIDPAENDANKRRRLEEFLGQWAAAPKEAPALFGELLGMEWPQDMPRLTANERREALFESLEAIVFQRARQHPVLLILEDIHWADRATLELGERIARRAPGEPLLFLCTSRPLEEPECVAQTEIETLPLRPLSPRDTDALIRTRAPRPLEEETVRALRRQSDGIPLFAEELAGAAADCADGSPAVPPSLEDLLRERLDGLEGHKRLAQLAATVGREVEPELLAAVTGQVQQNLEEELQVLCEHAVLQRLETVTGARYQFRHALIRHVAYQSQVRPDRRGAHGRIADALITSQPRRTQIHPEEVAHHLTEAGRHAEAVGYWLTAAHQAFDQWAVREADDLAQNGLLAHQHATEDVDAGAERQLLLIQAKARAHLEGYGADATEQLYQRALALAPEDGEDSGDRLAALYGLYMGSSAHYGHQQALEVARSLQASAGRRTEDTLQRVGDMAVGSTSFWLADYGTAEDHLRRACAWDDPPGWSALTTPEAARERIRDFSRDPIADALIYLGITWWDRGYAAAALTAMDHATALGRAVGHAYTLAAALAFRTALSHFAGQVRPTRELAHELLDLASEHELPVHDGFARLMLAWTEALSGEAGRLEGTSGAVGALRHGVGGIEPVTRLWLAETFRCLNRSGEGVEQADAGLAAAERLQERRSLPELYRLRGELLAQQAPFDTEGALEWIRHGLEIAEKQGSPTHALRCANAMARLHLMRGEVGKAREWLAPYWEAMPEDAGLPDWQAARRLLGLERTEASPPGSP